MESNVKMIVDKDKLTVRFECEGDIWEWLNKKGNRNSQTAYRVSESVRHEETHDFAYEMYLDKFVKKYRSNVETVVIV